MLIDGFVLRLAFTARHTHRCSVERIHKRIFLQVNFHKPNEVRCFSLASSLYTRERSAKRNATPLESFKRIRKPEPQQESMQESMQERFNHRVGLDETRGRLVASTILKGIQINMYGDVVEREFLRHELGQEVGVPARDLRALDSSFRNQMPMILTRPGAILINMEHVKAILRHDNIILLEPWQPLVKSLTNIMVERLKSINCEERGCTVPPQDPAHRPASALAEPSADSISGTTTDSMAIFPVYKVTESQSTNNDAALTSSAIPFEFICLEACLMSVCSSLDKRLQTLNPAITDALESARIMIDNQSLMKLLPLKSSLAKFEVTVHEVMGAIHELLSNDDDLAEMYLTTKAVTGAKRQQDQHEEVEMLLEIYYKQVQEISNELSSTKYNISSHEDIINIQLDSTRNQIMRLSLLISAGSVSLTSGALAAGIFGMNLLSSLETNPYAFATVSGVIGFGTSSFFLAIYKYCKNKRLL
eukprot:GILJ01014000.1.p1 GENE.GILJ01014000.1~~GILJ01014000.1.p1  ORF type:complete len:476 (+),score=63.25 GILJ01014000.1:39-1466(+)